MLIHSIVLLQYENVQESLAEKGVMLDLMTPITKITKQAIEEKSQRGFSLQFRKPAEILLSDHINEIHQAQQNYIDAISRAEHKFLLNVKECLKADMILGAPPITKQYSQEYKPSLKDGTKYLQCPMVNCSSATFKLRRHLESVHSHLAEYQVTYALELAKRMYRNSEPCTDISSPEKANRIVKTENYAARKDNPKECSVCGKLVINLSDHLGKIHLLAKDSETYKTKYALSELVPKCFTKIINGESVRLTGDELLEAQKNFNQTYESQTNALEQLKKVKDEMADLRSKLDETGDAATYASFKEKLSQLEEAYKTLRYVDT